MRQLHGLAAAKPRQTPPAAVGPLKLSPIPDAGSGLQLLAAGFAVWVIAIVTLVATRAPLLAGNLGDTDDALRLTMVRDLVAGRGWYDQKLTRLQPPQGVYIHWSRLIDGGEALVVKLFGLVLAPAQAEWAMRLTWPLLWILPVIIAVLLVARRLGGGRAVFLAAVAATLSFRASGEFLPGRVDHHNVQITCCLVALAAAVQAPTEAWAIVCGLSTALGLAIGLEAIVFLALIGAAMALSWALGRSGARSLALYGLALAGGAIGLHLVQTPPDRWTLSVCDAQGLNLVAGLAAAGLGVAITAFAAAGAGPALKLTCLVGVGALAGGVYLALDPACLHGPLAEMDPVVRDTLLAQVREMQPWPRLLAGEPATAVSLIAPVLVGVASLAWLVRRGRKAMSFALMLVGVAMIAATILTIAATRSAQYAIWFSAPLAGAALADFAGACLADLMLPSVALLLAASFAPIAAAAVLAVKPAAGDARSDSAAPPGDCTSAAALARLSRLPRGLVLSEIDEGPYILADTPHSVLQAPYHNRMGWGIRQASAVLAAPADTDEPELRRLGIRYVAACPAHHGHADRADLAPGALQNRLDAGRPPAWLHPLSTPSEALQIYALR